MFVRPTKNNGFSKIHPTILTWKKLSRITVTQNFSSTGRKHATTFYMEKMELTELKWLVWHYKSILPLNFHLGALPKETTTRYFSYIKNDQYFYIKIKSIILPDPGGQFTSFTIRQKPADGAVIHCFRRCLLGFFKYHFAQSLKWQHTH